MWKHVSASVRGSAHFTNGLPCQDASSSLQVGATIIYAISDGAGSARFADEGSVLIVDQAIAFFARLLEENPDQENLIAELDKSDGEYLISVIQDCLKAEANKRAVSDLEFSGTLLVGVFNPLRSRLYQVGDGVWCISKSGILGAATWPTQGEFAGQTVFVNSNSFRDSLQFAAIEGSIDYAVGMTDGLERLALELTTKVPHHGFCGPLVSSLNASTNPEHLKLGLETWLQSDRVCDRTDDDKSIVILTNVNDDI